MVTSMLVPSTCRMCVIAPASCAWKLRTTFQFFPTMLTIPSSEPRNRLSEPAQTLEMSLLSKSCCVSSSGNGTRVTSKKSKDFHCAVVSGYTDSGRWGQRTEMAIVMHWLLRLMLAVWSPRGYRHGLGAYGASAPPDAAPQWLALRYVNLQVARDHLTPGAWKSLIQWEMENGLILQLSYCTKNRPIMRPLNRWSFLFRPDSASRPCRHLPCDARLSCILSVKLLEAGTE